MAEVTLAGFDPVTALAVVTAARLIAGQIFRRSKEEAFDDTPTTLSAQGSRIPRLTGVRRVGPVHVWSDNRTVTTQKVKANGKGGAPQQTETIYYEEGIHVLAVGPGRALRRILVQGEPIFEGPIDPSNTPSGSLVELPNGEGTFQIYWGREDDPIDEWAGDESRLGVRSKWPFFFRINWHSRRLGQIAQWPITDYEIECEPDATIAQLNSEDSWFEGTLTEFGFAETDILAVDLSEGIIHIRGHVALDFIGAETVRVTGVEPAGSSILNIGDDYTVVDVTEEFATDTNIPVQNDCNNVGSGVANGFVQSGTLVTSIQVQEALPGTGVVLGGAFCQPPIIPNPGSTIGTTGVALSIGALTPLVEGDDNGANGAHIIADHLFQPFPQGIGLDQGFWDLNSLSTLSDVVVNEGIRSSTLADQGQTVQSLLGELLIDLGAFIRLNPQSGLLEFVPLRAAALPLLEVPEAAIQGGPPQIAYDTQPLRASRVIFAFSDRANGYRDETITVDADGTASLNQYEGVEETRIPTVTDFASAAIVAQRRDAEALGQTDQIEVQVGFAGRYIRPGDLIKIPEFPLNLLVLRSQFDPDDVGAVLQTSPTGYLAPATPLQLTSSNQATAGAPDPEVAAARLWTPPVALQVTSAPEANLLWVRANAATSSAIVNLSASGANYKVIGLETVVAVGGQLTESLAAVAGTVSSLEVRFDGPDAADTISLEGDQEAQDAGQLLCLIDDELFFIAGVTTNATNQGTVLSLQRAKYGTTLEAHSVGARFWIFQPNTLEALVDASLIQTGTAVFAKVQPIGLGAPPGLDEIESFGFTPTTPTS